MTTNDTPTPGQVCHEAYWRTFAPPCGPLSRHPWADVHPQNQAAWEAAAQAVRALPRTFEQKNALNQWAAARYDALMQEGKHGHYETMFCVIHEALALEDTPHG